MALNLSRLFPLGSWVGDGVAMVTELHERLSVPVVEVAVLSS